MTKRIDVRPVIMSGGSGTRLWPMSRRARPKQFHPATGETSLFQSTLQRVTSARGPFLDPVILASVDHEAIIRQELDAIGVVEKAILLEPVVRNTAPAIAAMAVLIAADSGGDVAVVLPADHMIAEVDDFAAALAAGAPVAAEGKIVTFGVTPAYAETGYGYIQAGAPCGAGAFAVKAFKEKPRLDIAQAYVDDGGYFWNGGIFMFRPDVMLDEMERHCPQILEGARRAVGAARRAGTSVYLDADAFGACEPVSIDNAVMELTDRAAVAPLDVGWSDVGSWAAWGEIVAKDEAGNAQRGDIALIDARDVLAWSDGPMVGAIGVENLVIIVSEGRVLVAPKSRAQDVKRLVERLKAEGRDDLL